MNLQLLFTQIASLLDDSRTIENDARDALLAAADSASYSGDVIALPQPVLDVMASDDALPVCRTIAQTPFNWAPPQTSKDALYIEHSQRKVHVELIGPEGIVYSAKIRLGLYGMLPDSEYGIRTHLAEEVYLMLAGQCYWKRDSGPYMLHGPGQRSYHPSMMPHATRTSESAFMSVYVWHGDISTDSYQYAGTT